MKGVFLIKTAPTEEPVTTAQAKTHMRVDISDDDTLIGTLIKAARRWIENLTGIRMVTQTWYYYLDAFPCGDIIKLPIGPVSSISSVKYTDADGAVSTLAASNYEVDTVSIPARIVLKENSAWPSTTLKVVNGVTIEFVAGYGAAAAVPEELTLALKMVIEHWYEHRGAVTEMRLEETPLTVQNLLADFFMYQRET